MSYPYIGIFADGSEQWCKKVGLRFPSFNEEEKSFYAQVRQGNKLFEKSYEEYKELLLKNLDEIDRYFCSKRRWKGKFLKYYNVGTDVIGNEYCGNTILCSIYIPIKTFGNEEAELFLRDMNHIAGRLAAQFRCTELPVYKYNDNLVVEFKDYHFFKSSPLKTNTDLAFVLFSVLCSINYVTQFIENCFVDEIPQKLKYAYLQYYYLCDFIKDLNQTNRTNYYLSNHLYNRNFRNCLAHYGLGQYLNEDEIIEDDLLKGLTYKAFDKDYVTTKSELYNALNNLTDQIKQTIF